MRLILLLCFFLPATLAFSQDLTGIWRGYFKSSGNRAFNSLNIEDRYKFETQILQEEKSFSGVTYSYQQKRFYGKASCYGSFNSKSKKVLLEENRLLEVRSESGDACLMTCFLQYSKVGDEEFLEGSYFSANARDSAKCGGGTVFLRKVPTSDFYKEPFLENYDQRKAPLVKTAPRTKKTPPVTKITPRRTDSATASRTVPPPRKPTPPPSAKKSEVTVKAKPRASKPPAPQQKASNNLKTIPKDSLIGLVDRKSPALDIPRVLAIRKNELVKTISTASNHITLKIYDNGSIDNDTVSVYIDKKLVVSKQRLTEKAIELDITLNQKSSLHELVMVAENLGEIPPNTSLMVVDTGTEQFEVRITSNEQKNAMVIFKYTP